MKTISFAMLAAFLVLGACKKEKISEKSVAKAKVYKLAAVYNPWTNRDTAPDYNETLTFYTDSTFEKHRTEGEKTVSANGHYTVTGISGEKFYKLSFNELSSLSVYGDWLHIQSSGSLVYDRTYVDGPRLTYKPQ